MRIGPGYELPKMTGSRMFVSNKRNIPSIIMSSKKQPNSKVIISSNHIADILG